MRLYGLEPDKFGLIAIIQLFDEGHDHCWTKFSIYLRPTRLALSIRG